ncbi:MAG TPA: amylo-alpha-1,6-glucosidase [Terriglobales bacterium]|nr:amylo-alpha-1,6-glucosidase [Terriglobales bacterium]
MISFGPETCRDLDAALSREWLETNGLGGFASSTIAGLNTRRYHGLLVAATQPPVGRVVLLSKLEETLIINGRSFDLSANQYPGVIHPQGYQYQTGFRLDPFPVFIYQVEGIEIEKSVFMVEGGNTTVVQYQLKTPRDSVRLEVAPLIAFRDYHSTTHENVALDATVTSETGLVTTAPYSGLPRLYLAHDADAVHTGGGWYRNFEYRVEQERGLDYREDLFNPLIFRFELTARTDATIIASTERHDVREASRIRKNEVARRASVAALSPVKDDFVRSLVTAADQFIVARGQQKTVIAGYHWFSDWGRDTMIALPGLTLVTGRFDVARSILLEFSKHVDQGMLPNRFPDAGERPEYNTVDATLWYFEAIRAYVEYTGDYEFVRQNLYDVLNDIIAWHVRGTRHGIRVEDSGLLASGAPGLQLTWMDAKVGDWVVTPRHGKPVEIQALWYNALRVLEDFAARFGDSAAEKRYAEMAAAAHCSFNRLFWNENAGCLYDVVNGGPPVASIRPNQVLAVSLKHSMLSPERAAGVVRVVARELLTAFGLRTLSPRDPRYIGHYNGDQHARDSAYHQGTVWPWLFGPFLSAYIRVNGGTAEARLQAAEWLEPFRRHLHEAGLGQVSEILDGNPPYRPRGCIAQAWSVAELLRAAVEEVFCMKPKSCPTVSRLSQAQSAKLSI